MDTSSLSSDDVEATTLNRDVDNLRVALSMARNLPVERQEPDPNAGSLDFDSLADPFQDLPETTPSFSAPANTVMPAAGVVGGSANPAITLRNIMTQNEGYVRECEATLTRIDNAITKNAGLQKRVRGLMADWQKAIGLRKGPTQGGSASAGGSAASKSRPAHIQPGKYFVDVKGQLPFPNADTVSFQRNRGRLPLSYKPATWTKEDRKNLARGVRQQNQQNLMQEALDKYESAADEGGVDSANELETAMARIAKLPNHELEQTCEGVDWAEVSRNYCPKWSALDCQLQWQNCDSPTIDKSPWTKQEDKILLALASKHKYYDWEAIASEMPTSRTPVACLRRYQRSLNTSLMRREWLPEDDAALMALVRKHGEKDWQFIAMGLPGRVGAQCMHRWHKTLNPEIKRGRWTDDEDLRLRTAIEIYGDGAYAKVRQHVPGRTDAQCRERWVNVLDPRTQHKVKWAEEEDMRLLQAVNELGMGKWSEVAKRVGKRTDNQCWRRYKYICPEEVDKHREVLAKQRGLVNNFAGRGRERPQLTAADFVLQKTTVTTGDDAIAHQLEGTQSGSGSRGAEGNGNAIGTRSGASGSRTTTQREQGGSEQSNKNLAAIAQVRAWAEQQLEPFGRNPPRRSSGAKVSTTNDYHAANDPRNQAAVGALAHTLGSGVFRDREASKRLNDLCVKIPCDLSLPYKVPPSLQGQPQESSDDTRPAKKARTGSASSPRPGSLADLARRRQKQSAPPRSSPAPQRSSESSPAIPARSKAFPPANFVPLPPTHRSMLAFSRIMKDVFPDAEIRANAEKLLPREVRDDDDDATTETPNIDVEAFNPEWVDSPGFQALQLWVQTLFAWPMTTALVASDPTIRPLPDASSLHSQPWTRSPRFRTAKEVVKRRMVHVMVDDSDLPVRAAGPIAVTGLTTIERNSPAMSAATGASPAVQASNGGSAPLRINQPLSRPRARTIIDDDSGHEDESEPRAPIEDPHLPESHAGRGRARRKRKMT